MIWCTIVYISYGDEGNWSLGERKPSTFRNMASILGLDNGHQWQRTEKWMWHEIEVVHLVVFCHLGWPLSSTLCSISCCFFPFRHAGCWTLYSRSIVVSVRVGDGFLFRRCQTEIRVCCLPLVFFPATFYFPTIDTCVPKHGLLMVSAILFRHPSFLYPYISVTFSDCFSIVFHLSLSLSLCLSIFSMFSSNLNPAYPDRLLLHPLQIPHTKRYTTRVCSLPLVLTASTLCTEYYLTLYPKIFRFSPTQISIDNLYLPSNP